MVVRRDTASGARKKVCIQQVDEYKDRRDNRLYREKMTEVMRKTRNTKMRLGKGYVLR